MRARLVATTICIPLALAGAFWAITPAVEAAVKTEPITIAAPLPLARSAATGAPLPLAPPVASAVPGAQPSPAPTLEAPPTPTPAAASEPGGLVGVFLAREAAEVAAASPGKLAEVRVQIGDRVRAGDIVASLHADVEQLDLAVAQAQAFELQAEYAVMHARAQIASAEDLRIAALSDSGLASGGERAAAAGQRREAALRSQLARAGSARQQAAIARLMQARQDKYVLAPFDGVVVARYVDPGSSVGPERPILRIVRDGPLTVRFALPEQSALRIEPGTRVRARVVASGVELPACVRRVAAEVDGAGRFTVIEAETERGDAGALAGAAAEVSKEPEHD